MKPGPDLSLLFLIVTKKFKQWWPTMPPISTKPTHWTTEHKKDQDIKNQGPNLGHTWQLGKHCKLSGAIKSPNMYMQWFDVQASKSRNLSWYIVYNMCSMENVGLIMSIICLKINIV